MRPFHLLALALVSALAACGGAGSSAPSAPATLPPTSAPPTSYAVQLRYVDSALLGNTRTAQIQSDLAHIDTSGTATPAPILIVSQLGNGCLGHGCYGTAAQGVVQAVVSPIPSASPTATFSTDAAHVEFASTPVPPVGATPDPSVIAAQGVAADTTPLVQSGGTATVTVGSPVNTTASIPVYHYAGIAADCIPSAIGNTASGWYYNGTTWAPTTDPNQADVYVTGSLCSGAFGVPGDAGTVHFPGGGTFVSTDNPFWSVAASSWANAETSLPMSTIQTQNPDGSFNVILIAKTRDGAHIFKFFGLSVASTPDFEGAVEVSGASIDGF